MTERYLVQSCNESESETFMDLVPANSHDEADSIVARIRPHATVDRQATSTLGEQLQYLQTLMEATDSDVMDRLIETADESASECFCGDGASGDVKTECGFCWSKRMKAQLNEADTGTEGANRRDAVQGTTETLEVRPDRGQAISG